MNTPRQSSNFPMHTQSTMQLKKAWSIRHTYVPFHSRHSVTGPHKWAELGCLLWSFRVKRDKHKQVTEAPLWSTVPNEISYAILKKYFALPRVKIQFIIVWNITGYARNGRNCIKVHSHEKLHCVNCMLCVFTLHSNSDSTQQPFVLTPELRLNASRNASFHNARPQTLFRPWPFFCFKHEPKKHSHSIKPIPLWPFLAGLQFIRSLKRQAHLTIHSWWYFTHSNSSQLLICTA